MATAQLQPLVSDPGATELATRHPAAPGRKSPVSGGVFGRVPRLRQGPLRALQAPGPTAAGSDDRSCDRGPGTALASTPMRSTVCGRTGQRAVEGLPGRAPKDLATARQTARWARPDRFGAEDPATPAPAHGRCAGGGAARRGGGGAASGLGCARAGDRPAFDSRRPERRTACRLSRCRRPACCSDSKTAGSRCRCRTGCPHRGRDVPYLAAWPDRRSKQGQGGEPHPVDTGRRDTCRRR